MWIRNFHGAMIWVDAQDYLPDPAADEEPEEQDGGIDHGPGIHEIDEWYGRDRYWE